MLKALVSQGGDPQFDRLRMAPRALVSPWGRIIDAYVFGRSYQEREKGQHGTVVDTLDASDPRWRERELIILPSHVTGCTVDIDEIIRVAHRAGFDIICATVIFTEHIPEDRRLFADIWEKAWDERWTIPNPRRDPEDRNLAAQLSALGCDLWTWICRALAS
ncbi:MAG: hypothetical protein JO305_04535 [Alphaproteobacteria bacterium]|nr:hypothetical protein [Alphaproteobacteria bacterium]